MEQNELQTFLCDRLKERVQESCAAYEKKMLRLPAHRLIDKAEEIAATRFCRDELTENAASYDQELLKFLHGYLDPLLTLRDLWMDYQAVDRSHELSHVLCSLREPGQKAGPSMGGMTIN